MFEKEFSVVMKNNNVYLKEGLPTDEEGQIAHIIVFNSENKLYYNTDDEWLLVEVTLPNESSYGKHPLMKVQNYDVYYKELNKVEDYLEQYMFVLSNEIDLDYYTIFVPRSKLAEIIYKLFEFGRTIQYIIKFEPNQL